MSLTGYYVLDVWTIGHLWLGYAAARLSLRLFQWTSLMLAWEWLEASGLGPLGADPGPLNSVVDVVAGLAAFLVVRYVPARWHSRGVSDAGDE